MEGAMKRLPNRTIAVALLLLAIALGVFFLAIDERNRLMFTQPKVLGEGETFLGVSLSMPAQVAERTLIQQDLRLTDYGSDPQMAATCGPRVPEADEELKIFNDSNSWRIGLVCVFEREGRVVSMFAAYLPNTP
jgi:hypothetical protein